LAFTSILSPDLVQSTLRSRISRCILAFASLLPLDLVRDTLRSRISQGLLASTSILSLDLVEDTLRSRTSRGLLTFASILSLDLVRDTLRSRTSSGVLTFASILTLDLVRDTLRSRISRGLLLLERLVLDAGWFLTGSFCVTGDLDSGLCLRELRLLQGVDGVDGVDDSVLSLPSDFKLPELPFKSSCISCNSTGVTLLLPRRDGDDSVLPLPSDGVPSRVRDTLRVVEGLVDTLVSSPSLLKLPLKAFLSLADSFPLVGVITTPPMATLLLHPSLFPGSTLDESLPREELLLLAAVEYISTRLQRRGEGMDLAAMSLGLV
jgi:hypothetical protein